MPLSSTVSDAVQKPLTKMADGTVNVHAPLIIPEVGDILDAFQRKTMSQRRLTRLLRMHGVYVGPSQIPEDALTTAKVYGNLEEVWTSILAAKGNLLSEVQLNILWNRGIIGEADVDKLLPRLGWNYGVNTDWLKALKDEIPGPSDLVTFVVRDIWRPDLVKKYGYDLDFPQQFADWIGKQGLNYTIPSPDHVKAGLGDLTWAKAYWWAHWQVPSVGQGIQMVQRLRGTLRDPNVPRDPSGIIFTRQDLLELIQVSDYPKYWQDKLMAIGYVPIGIRNLRALWATGLVDEVGVTEIFMDQGYTERDARTQARLIATEKRETMIAAQKVVALRASVKSYELGLLSYADAGVQVFSSLIRTQNQLAAFRNQPVAQQEQQALNDRLTLMILGNADLSVQQSRFQRITLILRRSYIRGMMDEPTVRQQLQNLGMIAARVDQTVADWKLELTIPRRLPNLSQTLKWLNDGLITADQARTQLSLLGYSSDDQDAILVEAALDSIGKRVKAVKARANAVRREQTLAAQQVRSALILQRQAQQALAKSANPTRLAKWFAEGLIPASLFMSRIEALGISPADAALWAKEILLEQSKKKPPAPAKPAPVLNQAGVKLRQPPVATVGGWYKKGFIQLPEFETRLAEMGFLPEAIVKYKEQYAPA